MKSLLSISLAMVVASPTLLFAEQICTGKNRAERKVTCIVDGDTGWDQGRKWRLKNFDAPELAHPACALEKAKALEVRDYVAKLISKDYQLTYSGEVDKFGRYLVDLNFWDGDKSKPDLGLTLFAKGMVQRWPNKGNIWCDSKNQVLTDGDEND